MVDPDEAGAQQLAWALRNEHSANVVGSSAEALAAIQVQMPTMVVTELDLPDASGLDLLALLRRQSATRHVLLMVLSRRTAIQDKIAAFQSGADDYLVKPVSAQMFAAHVRQLAHFRQLVTTVDA
jgi:DNA-binding response OmpR family regulator